MTEFNLITACGKDLAQYFEGIDFESFVSLQPDQIKEAIPSVIHRIMFENRFNKFLKTISQSIGSPKETVVQIIPLSSHESGNGSYDQTDEPFFDENFDVINVASSSAGTPKLVPDSQKQLKKKTVIKTVQDIIDIPDIELKIIITKHVDKKVPMDNNDRIVTGKAIIHHLLVNDFERQIAKPEFISLAELVVQLFPYETRGTFYTPAIRNLQAQGKLYSAYQNYRTLLRVAGLITKREKAQSEEGEDLEAERDLLEEKSEALKLLLESNEDFEQIKIAWRLCHSERYKFVNELSTFEYMRRFPAFDLSTGYELLILDADTLYPNKISKLLEIAPKIVAYASRVSQKKKAPLEMKALILEYNEFIINIDEESVELKTLQALTVLRLLPHLMPNPKRKLTKSEVGNIFCPYFKTAKEADKYNATFNNDYKNTDLVLKPRIYFVGALPDPCANIRIGNHTYSIENTLTGFEILFKSFLALKCQYPDQTKHIWQFIRKEVYDIDGEDKQLASVEAFIKDLQYHMNLNNH